ncbi:unnamed protein product [Paramecium primaurelia]|uniref:Autophagy protein ATG17-like domain-containing protein n=1 Tax=Paramecium primaurelia TaxID=5886 RepID=A0A8S1Q1G3_PARPR|nr:unnamed protein product [Paramecium primaurelia]
MDFIIKIGIDGHQFLLTLQAENKRLQYLQEQIQNETKVEVKNQLLLTKKGVKLEDLNQFDVDQQLQQTVQQFPDEQKFYTIYLFDLSENPEQVVYPFPKYEPKMDLKQLLLSEQAKETLINLNSNIINHEKIFFQHLQNLKNKYIPYQQKVKQLEKIGQDLENQIQSFDIVLKMSRTTYKNSKAKKEELTKKQKESLERNLLTVKKFDDSLEQLKKIELHAALQTNSQKYLSDIYYKPESMLKWKNSCLNTQQNLKQKIDKLSQAISKSKQKIKNEKTENMTQCLSSYKANQQQYQQFIQENKSLLQSVVQSTIDEYNTLRQYMIDFSQDINDEPAMYYLSQFELSQEQIKQFEDAVTHIGDHLEKTKQVFMQFTQLKQQNMSKILKVFQNLRALDKEFEQHNEKIRQYDEEVEKMEKDFSYLLNPVLLPQAYQQALIETSRRKEFRDIFDKKIKSLMSLIDQEKDKRKKFLQQYGRILPQDFIGQLKNLTPSIQIINAFADAELPNITGLHTDTFKKRQDNDVDQLKQQIEDLNQQCKQTHLFYQEKTTKKSTTYIELLQLTAKNSMKMFIQRAENKPLSSIDTNTDKSQRENDSKLMNLKNEFSEQLNNQKQEYEKLKIRLQKQEQDFESKLVEIDNKNNMITELQQKIESLQNNTIKLKDDLNKFVSKCENLEINLIQKNSEISKLQQLQKQLNDQLNQSKQIQSDLLKHKQSIQQQCETQNDQINELDLLNKQYLQQVQDYYAQLEVIQNENEKLKQKLKMLELERDNKQVELDKQIQVYNELLEDYLEKNSQLENLNQDQIEQAQKDLQLEEDQKTLQNKIDNLDLALQQKNNEIILLKNQDQLQLLKAQDDFKEIQLQYEDKINCLTQENLDLTIQIQSLQGQIDYLNQKQKSDNIIEVQQKLKLSDPQFQFDLSTISIGKQSIFIPAQNDVYVPLLLKNIQVSNISDDSLSNTSIDSSNKQKLYRVQLTSIPQALREFIIDTGLLFISEVSNIIETEEYFQIIVNQPNYIIGFEGQDNQIKSFTL